MTERKRRRMRRQREEGQRSGMAKKQRGEERERGGGRGSRGTSTRGRKPGTIKLTSPGARASQNPGARPSFQYRDGAFICDLCKESFSDGNDMVTHWKSHVKKQQTEGKAPGSGRGRPPVKREYRSDSEEDQTPPRKRGPRKST